MSLLKFYEAVAWLAIGKVKQSGVVSNNMGVIADVNRTPQEEYLKVTQRIGSFLPQGNANSKGSVRSRWVQYCGSDFDPRRKQQEETDVQFQHRASEQCMISGGMQRLQQLSEEMKAGNCTEKCAIAIMRLAEWDVRNVDFMELNTHSREQLDHTFLVLGRLKGSIDKSPQTWGDEAVVCDPWHDYGKVYPATDIEAKMYRGYGGHQYSGPIMPKSIFRL